MTKIKEVPEEVIDPFGGFDILNQNLNNPAPKLKVSKKEEPKEKEPILKEVEDDDLSEDELAALEAASKPDKGKTTKKVVEDDIKETSIEQKETEDSNPFLGFAKFLEEEGVIDLEEGEKIESEKDLLRVTDNTIKKGITKYKETIPEDGKKFLEFIEQGGKPADFHKYYYEDGSFEEFNIDNEENQEYVIREALKLEDYDEAEIEDQINLYKDTEKLATKAATHLKKLQKVEKEQKNIFLESQKQYAKQEEEKRQAEWDSFKKGLFDKEKIGSFPMTPKTKNDLWDYMTKVVDKKSQETAYQKDMKENEDSRYIFAYLLKNKWDVSSLEKSLETKKVSELRGKLGNFTDTRQKQKSPQSKITKDDIDSDPFAGFAKLKI